MAEHNLVEVLAVSDSLILTKDTARMLLERDRNAFIVWAGLQVLPEPFEATNDDLMSYLKMGKKPLLAAKAVLEEEGLLVKERLTCNVCHKQAGYRYLVKSSSEADHSSFSKDCKTYIHEDCLPLVNELEPSETGVRRYRTIPTGISKEISKKTALEGPKVHRRYRSRPTDEKEEGKTVGIDRDRPSVLRESIYKNNINDHDNEKGTLDNGQLAKRTRGAKRGFGQTTTDITLPTKQGDHVLTKKQLENVREYVTEHCADFDPELVELWIRERVAKMWYADAKLQPAKPGSVVAKLRTWAARVSAAELRNLGGNGRPRGGGLQQQFTGKGRYNGTARNADKRNQRALEKLGN